MPERSLQDLCEEGQRKLVETDYYAAEKLLMHAELVAWNARDWDTLSRVYMPLQEARRQRRQRSGEGIVKLDLVARTADTNLDADDLIARYTHGQLLVAGFGTIEPAVSLRRLAWERGLYLETFLGAVYPVNDRFVVAIVPTADIALPPVDGRPLDRLLPTLPPFSVVLSDDELIPGERKGDDATYAQTMALWEKLHLPFLAAAEQTADPIRKMAAFRRVIEVDYASELAHQHLSITARKMLQRA
jgi:hypothetical protein